MKEDTEKLDILAEKDDDKDSGNNSADTDSPEPDPERQSLLQTQHVNPLIEAAKPKFRKGIDSSFTYRFTLILSMEILDS